MGGPPGGRVTGALLRNGRDVGFHPRVFFTRDVSGGISLVQNGEGGAASVGTIPAVGAVGVDQFRRLEKIRNMIPTQSSQPRPR
jgi:hypothetical protein